MQIEFQKQSVNRTETILEEIIAWNFFETDRRYDAIVLRIPTDLKKERYKGIHTQKHQSKTIEKIVKMSLRNTKKIPRQMVKYAIFMNKKTHYYNTIDFPK